MDNKDNTRLIFLKAIEPFLSHESYRNMANNIDIIEERLAVAGYFGELVQDLIKHAENNAHNKDYMKRQGVRK